MALPDAWRRKIAVALAVAAARAGVASSQLSVLSGLHSALMHGDRRAFRNGALLGLGLAAAYDALDRAVDLCQRHLGTDMRLRLCERLMAKYFDTAAFYFLFLHIYMYIYVIIFNLFMIK